jgi:hypothetical protein
MNNPVIWTLALAHLIGSVVFLALRFGRLGRRKEYLVPILCIPVFGPLLAFTIDLMYAFGKPGLKPVDVEALKLEQNIYWNSVERPEADPSVVPLEEAILINDKHTRREEVLDTFRHNSLSYLDVLLLARDNEDTDTTHYATIRITKIHRRFQLALQQFAVEHEEHPEDLAILNKYLDLLEEYIASPLPDELMLRRQKAVYAQLLDKGLALAPNDRRTMIRKLRLCITMKDDYAAALALAEQLKQRWPDDEQTWIESLRLCVEWHDQEGLEAALRQIQSAPVNWTRQGRALVAPWLHVGEKEPA